MLEHHCAALFIAPMPKHRWRTLMTISPTPKHLCSALSNPSHSQKHPIPPSFSLLKQLRPALVSLFPLPLLQHHSQQLFLLLKHRLSATFHPFSCCWNTNCQQLFIRFPDTETSLFSTFHPLPIIFISPFIIHETIPSSNCFAAFVAETPFTSNLSSFHPWCWNTTIQHPTDFFRHWNTRSQQFFIAIFRSFSVAATPALQRQYRQQAVTWSKRQPTNSTTMNKHHIRLV